MQVGEVAEPAIDDRDVLVDVHAAGVNLLDAKIRDGEFKLFLPYKAPFILGHDLAGVVTRVGSAVTRFSLGDEVYATARRPHRHLRRAHRRGRGRSRDQARQPLHGRGGLGALVALTAWQALVERANLQPRPEGAGPRRLRGRRRLRDPAGQAPGATVTTTTGTSNLEWVRDLVPTSSSTTNPGLRNGRPRLRHRPGLPGRRHPRQVAPS